MNGSAALSGVPLVLTDNMPDGELFLIQDPAAGRRSTFLLGTGPVDTYTWCKREARVIVHQGLRDVLEWLGWPVTTGHPSSAGVVASLRAGGAS